ncbi:DUF3180 domain-containing protein [Salinibacterium sp. ZJ70]|uniref:DUF3180 domain-containing protein n=1 Tax=Salinibacterium sp. ZJ70 TaxID=2708084 RepID=UPI001422D069|nr:DUF3180 domain-containing protein [Salinibacterium sp. ZJ70]
MTRTRALPLVVLAVIGGIAALLLQLALGAAGMPKLTPQVSLSVTLVLIGVVVVALALPVRRAVRTREHARVDPFYATRVVLIAQASALSGALFAGAALGLLVELLGRPVVTTSGVWGVVAMIIASLALMIAGLVAEAFCVVPPDDDDPASGPTATT